MDTLNDVLTKVSAVVSQTTDVTNTSDEYGLWRSYANMAQKEWSEVYNWPSLYKEYNTQTSNPSGNATIQLPADFRKLSGYPRLTADGTTTNEYPEISPQVKGKYNSEDEYCYVLNSSGKYYLIVNPGTAVSGASIFVSYWRSPASLCSPADIIDCPNPDYMVQRIIAQVWESREDARFPQAKAEAEKILSRLLEAEVTPSYAYDNRVLTQEEKSYDFKIGRD